jgi:hypothetical protein
MGCSCDSQKQENETQINDENLNIISKIKIIFYILI